MTAKWSKLDKACFLNVDLDIRSSSDLEPLVSAFGDKVIEMWVGRVRRTYEAHLELGGSHLKQSPTSIILGFCKLIKALPRSKRKLWDLAKTRSFDVGIAAPSRNRHFWEVISSEAVSAAAEVGAQIAITVYGPMRPVKSKMKRGAEL